MRMRALTLPLLIGACAHPAPSMRRVEPDRTGIDGLVVAAPHAGFDRMTGEIAGMIAERLGVPLVIASDYRAPKAGRYINVNRPTASDLDEAGKASNEHETPEARAAFEAWKELVGGEALEAVALYVEIHGNSREELGKPVDVIETATLGLSPEDIRQIKEIWKGENTAYPPLPRLVFDITDPEYAHAGSTVAFHYKASKSHALGILQEEYVKTALHFELPRSVRRTSASRRRVAQALAEVISGMRIPVGE